MQMSQEITVCCPSVFEAGDQMIMIGKESPCLQDNRVVACEFKSCVAKKVEFCIRIKESFSMQCCGSNDVSAVRDEIMWRGVRPTRACTISYHENSTLRKPFLLLKNPFRFGEAFGVRARPRVALRGGTVMKAMRGRIALLKHFRQGGQCEIHRERFAISSWSRMRCWARPRRNPRDSPFSRKLWSADASLRRLCS